MAVRMGELMVVVRAQDFASRTLHRVSGELAGMSRAQALARNQMMLSARQARLTSRIQAGRGEMAALNVAKQRVETVQSLTAAQNRLNKALGVQFATMAQTARVAQTRRAPSGRFTTAFAQKQALEVQGLTRNLAALDAQLSVLPPRFTAMTRTWGNAGSALAGIRERAAKVTESLRAMTVQEKLLYEEQMMLNRAIAMMPVQRMHDIGAALSGVGRTMQLIGGIGTGIFAVAANSFANFSENAATAGTQMRNLNAPMAQAVQRSKQLREAILDMSMIFPATAADMSDAAYDIFSSMNLMNNGVMNVQGGLKLLGIANKLAVAGQVDLKEATNAMIVALNTFDPALRDVSGTMDTMMNIVRYGKLRVDDLSRSFTSFSAVAKASGLTLKSVGGAFASLTLFMPSDRAAAGLGRLIEIFRNPVFRTGFKNMGVDVEKANGQLRPLLSIMKDIARLRPDLTSGQTSALQFFIQVSKASGATKAGIQGTVQARRAFEQLITHMATFSEVSGEVAKNQGELNNAFRARMADPGVQWAIFKNQLKALVLVIGQDALPVFLKLGDMIGRFVKWLHGMNSGTRGTIVHIAALASVLILVTGISLSLAGSLTQVAANLAAMRVSAALSGKTATQAAVGFIRLRTAILGIVGIGLFILIEQVLGLRDAVLIMTTAWLLWRTKALQTIAFVVAANIAGAATVKEAWRVAMASTGWGLLVVASGVAAEYVMRNWDKVRAYFKAWQADVFSGFENFWHKTALSAQWWGGRIVSFIGIVGEKVGLDSGMKDLGDRWMSDAREGWNNLNDTFTQNYRKFLAQYRKQRKGMSGSDFLKDWKRITADLVSADARKAWDDWANAVGDSTGKAANLAKAHANAIQEATRNMNETIKTATTNLMNQYETLQQANQAALGGLFQGPTMSGILGNIFSNLNDTLRQFGVQIPVPFKILKQDLDQSIMYFKRWRTAINNLLKRGMPFEMVSEIQALGPAQGLSIAEGLLTGSKAGWRSIIKAYRTGQRLTDKATKEDMARKLKYWESFGKDAAWATIMGIINNPKNVQIQKLYENYVKNTYGAILKKTFQDDVATYMANAIADAQAAAAAADFKIPPPPTNKGLTPQQRAAQRAGLSTLSPQALTRQYRMSQSKVNTLLHFVGPLTRTQRNVLNTQQRRMRLIRQEYARDAAASASVRRQFRRERRDGDGNITVTYQGDTVTIKADGATVDAVGRALARKHFAKKHKRTRGSASRVYPKPSG